MDNYLLPLVHEYDQWISTIDMEQQIKYHLLMRHSFIFSEQNRQKHIHRFNFGYKLAGFKFKDKTEYLKEELYSVYKELNKTSLVITWQRLERLYESVNYRMHNFKKEHPEKNSFELFLFEDEDEYNILFWAVLTPLGNINYYSIINDLEAPELNISNSPAFNDYMEFTGLFLYMIELLNYLFYFGNGNESENRIANVRVRTLKPKIQTFESLFLNVKNAEIVEKLFETNGYTIKRHWQGESGNAGELSRAYYALKDMNILISGAITRQTETFYKHFKLADDYCDEKTRTRKDHNSDYIKFKKLFSHLTPL